MTGSTTDVTVTEQRVEAASSKAGDSQHTHPDHSTSPHVQYPPAWIRDRRPLDFAASSTATNPSHAAQDVSTTVKTGRHAYTENATFTAEKMPAKSDVFESLNELNRNFYADEDDSVGSARHRQDHQNDTQMWGRVIGLTDAEIRRAQYLLARAEAGWMNNHSAAAVVLAALTVAANERSCGGYTKAIRESAPDTGNPALVNAYEELRSRLQIPADSIRACRDHLRNV